MTNRQAAKLRVGDRVRLKGLVEDGPMYVVEQIERIPVRSGVDIAVHADGQVFMAWEIGSCNPHQGWPSTRKLAEAAAPQLLSSVLA